MLNYESGPEPTHLTRACASVQCGHWLLWGQHRMEAYYHPFGNTALPCPKHGSDIDSSLWTWAIYLQHFCSTSRPELLLLLPASGHSGELKKANATQEGRPSLQSPSQGGAWFHWTWSGWSLPIYGQMINNASFESWA